MFRRDRFGEFDRFVDGHPVGDVLTPEQFQSADPQDVAIDRRHPLKRPLLRVVGQHPVDVGEALDNTLDQADGVFRHRRIGLRETLGKRVGEAVPAHVGLVEDVESALASLRPGAQLVTRPR